MAGLDAKELPEISEKDMEELKAALGKGNLTEAAAKAKEALEMADKITLNIAVTGQSGTGKSSFVNAIRCLRDTDDGAAEIGVTETTMKPTAYPHPSYPNVIVWDLPGIGTENFKYDTYLQQVEFSRYDFFIIISGTRFTSHDINLAKEIQRLGKKFYFVHSKVDQDLKNEKKLYDKEGILKQKKVPMKRPYHYSDSAILNTIREDCIKCLEKGGVTSPQVFLISRWDLHKYDFPKLQKVLVDELPSHKKLTLLRSLYNISKETLEKKKERLQAQIWLKSLASCGVAAVPVPGLSTALDITLLVMSLKEYCRDFGLSENSLTTLARQANKPIAELKAVIQSPLREEITKELVIKLVTKCTAGGVKYSAYIFNYYPVLGSVVSAAVSLPTTYFILQNFLNVAADDAVRVLEVILKGNVSQSEKELKS